MVEGSPDDVVAADELGPMGGARERPKQPADDSESLLGVENDGPRIE